MDSGNKALLEVIGDVSRTNRLNNLVRKHFSLRLIGESVTEWEQEHPKRHIIDGLAFSRNNNVILFDAKNYKNWNGLGIGDVLKQYAYERLVKKIKETNSDQPSWNDEFSYSSFDYLRNEIIANVFVFPLNSMDTSEEETDVDVQVVGRYNIDYMVDDDLNEDLICVEINPDMVLKQYSENSRALHSRFIEVVSDSAPSESTNAQENPLALEGLRRNDPHLMFAKILKGYRSKIQRLDCLSDLLINLSWNRTKSFFSDVHRTPTDGL